MLGLPDLCPVLFLTASLWAGFWRIRHRLPCSQEPLARPWLCTAFRMGSRSLGARDTVTTCPTVAASQGACGMAPGREPTDRLLWGCPSRRGEGDLGSGYSLWGAWTVEMV